MRRLGLVMLVLLMVGGTLALAGCSGRMEPKELIETFYTHLQKQEYQQAYDLMSAFYRNNHTFDKFKETVMALDEEKGPITGWTMGKEERSGTNSALVDMTLTRTLDGEAVTEEFRVAIAGGEANKGQWRMSENGLR